MKAAYVITTLALGAAGSPAPAPQGDDDSYRAVKAFTPSSDSYIATTAPHDNIFAGISDKEMDSIYSFLSKPGVTNMPGNASYDTVWLLPPNKTESLSYLDGSGPKPRRFARAMGRAGCFDREFMVGPLPVGDNTKAMPLNYVNNGNATLDTGYCDQGNNARRSMPPALRSRIKNEKRRLQSRYPHDPYEEKLGWNGRKLPHDDKAPPVVILPDGPRHEYDPKQNYVSWMDFTFYVSTGPGGVALHDVRFRGERIIYELAMQEALAHYAGPDEDQTRASYLDVTIGFEEFNLIPGYDCPAYATYTDAFCLFEFPQDFPLNRHASPDYLHATKNTAFMLRSISTVGNYDYQTTYEFHKDGSLQVLVRASGYIQGSDLVNNTESRDYGFHIREGLYGSMHDHVLNFKADVDIHGTKNSLFKTEFVPHTQVYDWSHGKPWNSMKAERSFVANEDQGKINWAANAAAAYSVVNKDKENELGEYPGFRIYPSTGASVHLTVEKSSVFGNLVNWATHQLYALRRKDSEPVSAHPAAITETQRSLVDFARFFDGESLEQEDIVLYFNLGMHHMPDTYDLPNTVFQGAQSGITFRPQNYLTSENSMSTIEQIMITDDNGAQKVDTYGSKTLSGSYNLASANPSIPPLFG